MQGRKGQGVIIEVLAFAMSIMLAMLVFIVMVSTDSITQYSAEESITNEISELRMRSTISITMNDRLWRVNGVSKGDYSNWPAYKVISQYFSTQGDTMYIYDDEVSRNQAKQDIKSYMEYKMDTYYQDGPNQIDYYLEISNLGETGPTNLTVKTYNSDSSGARVTYPIGTVNGSVAEATVRISQGSNIYSIGG